MKSMFKKLVFALGASLITMFGSAAFAQSYPNKPVRIIVGFPSGTGVDVAARVVAEAMGDKIGQRFIVENKPGANGAIAAETVANAAPDGYTLLIASSSTLSITPHIVKNRNWNPIKSFDPIVEVGSTSLVYGVAKNSPISSMPDLIKAARAKPGSIRVGIVPLGLSQLSISMLQNMEKLDFLVVPYKGTAEIVAGVLGGEIDVAVAGFTPQFGSGGVLKPIGVSSATRIRALPDTPAIGDAVKGYEIASWTGLFGPAGVNPAIVSTLNKAANDIIRNQKIKSRLEDTGLAPTGGKPDALFGKLENDYKRFGVLIGQIENLPR